MPLIEPADNAADIQNPNKGSSGTNKRYDQNQGNRGKQLNPNRQKFPVTFRTPQGLLPSGLCEAHKVRHLSLQEFRNLFRSCPSMQDETSWEMRAYDYFQFKKAYKG